jgi:uncharacterized protein YecT (DUF1311 family)
MGFTMSILAFLLATAATDVSKKARVDCRNASTQLELNQCAVDDLVRERQRMDRTLARVYAERPERERAVVQVAQRAWQGYADAQIEALYPGCGASAACGSAHGMCRAAALSALMKIRTAELDRMLRDHQREGDVCAPQSAYDGNP